MKIAGIVLVTLGALALMGAISAGDNILGPLVWIIVGVFLIVRANHKIKYNEKQARFCTIYRTVIYSY